jgi:regulator of sigma E protease
MFLTIITFVIVLSILVFVHELGHFMTARKFGVKAEEFGLGFPPRAIGWYKNTSGKWSQTKKGQEVTDAADTIYSLNWIPLGGFVKIKGENGEEKNDKDSFAARPVWQRFLILAAGVTMNVVLAMVLLGIGYMIGLPQSTTNVGKYAKIENPKVQIYEIMPNSPADKAKLTAGDIILSIDGSEVKTESEMQNLIGAKSGQEITLKIKHLNEEQEKKVTPEFNNEAQKGLIGVAITSTATVSYPWYIAIWQGIKSAIFLLWMIIVALYELIKNLIIGAPIAGQVAGPIGIATITGQAARLGIAYLLQFTALLSLNLAVINFIPFPALDGGRSLFLLLEKIKGRPVKKETEAIVHNIGFILLMLLVVVVTFKDVLNFFK